LNRLKYQDIWPNIGITKAFFLENLIAERIITENRPLAEGLDDCLGFGFFIPE
jgi:hypothetical protein